MNGLGRSLLQALMLAWACTPPSSSLTGAEQPADPGGIMERHEMVPMRDGKKLSTWMYFPPGKGPWPVLYQQRYANLRAPQTRQGFARLAVVGGEEGECRSRVRLGDRRFGAALRGDCPGEVRPPQADPP